MIYKKTTKLSENQKNEDEEIGIVITSNIKEDKITMYLKKQPKDVFIGMPITIRSGRYNYFCMITNVYQSHNRELAEIARRKIELSSENTGNPNSPQYKSVYVELRCLKRWTIDPETYKMVKQNFISIPDPLSHCYISTMEDIKSIYSQKGNENYWFGTLAAIPPYNNQGEYNGLPIMVQDIISKPLGIFGITGSGKSVTMRNLCKMVIQNPGDTPNVRKSANASLLIFDPQDGYAYNINDKEGENGLLAYESLRRKTVVFTLDPEKWDQNVPSYLQCKYGHVHKFTIFEENLTTGDLLSILSKDVHFSDKMKRSIRSMGRVAKKRNVSLYEVIEEYLKSDIEDKDGYAKYFSGNENSYYALSQRLEDILHIIRKFMTKRAKNQKDTYEQMKMYLDQEIYPSVDETKSFIVHFGRYGSKKYIYEFVANYITYRFYQLYNDNFYINDKTFKYRQLIVLLEEAHKFISKTNENVFKLIARETRKYGLTLWYVDQIPSSIDEEIVTQSAHRIVHKLNGYQDINVALSGLKSNVWGHIVSNLQTGQCIVFGDMIRNMPSVFNVYFAYGKQKKEEKDRNMISLPSPTAHSLNTKKFESKPKRKKTPRISLDPEEPYQKEETKTSKLSEEDTSVENYWDNEDDLF